MTPSGGHEKRFYWSMRLVVAGLVVELASLAGLHQPLGFMAFAAVGCVLTGIGIAVFITTLFASTKAAEREASE